MQTIRWLQKVARFRITDPWLRYVAAHCEPEIPWLKQVRDESSLLAYVQDTMLPGLLAQLDKKVFADQLGVTTRHVNVAAALDGPGLPQQSRIRTRQCLYRGQDDAARQLVVDHVNLTKRTDFLKWRKELADRFGSHPAFVYLVLRAVFEAHGRGQRRSPTPPQLGGLSWLFRQGRREALEPKANLFETYAERLASVQGVTSNGWIHVPQGSVYAGRLATLARGSGWCVASSSFAETYLKNCEFFILYEDNRPVIGLRISQGTIVECQARYNSIPEPAYVDDILFVGHTMEFSWSRGLFLAGRSSEPLTTNATERWWRARLANWPFALHRAPAQIQRKLADTALRRMVDFVGMPAFETFVQPYRQAGQFKVDAEVLLARVASEPWLYREWLFGPELAEAAREACVEGWIWKVETGDVALEGGGAQIPQWVLEDPQFIALFSSNLPAAVVEHVVKRPRSRMASERPRNLLDIIPATPNESESLAVLRVAEAILHHNDSNFKDWALFDSETLDREDFEDVRRKGWHLAYQRRPSVFFAIPDDLRGFEEFQPNQQCKAPEMLARHLAKVSERPWLLDQKAAVPRAVRWHPLILLAYRDAWCKRLCRKPSRLHVVLGSYGQPVYVANTLLADPAAFNALATGFRRNPREQEKVNYDAFEITAVCQALSDAEAPVAQLRPAPAWVELLLAALPPAEAEVRRLQDRLAQACCALKRAREVRTAEENPWQHKLAELHFGLERAQRRGIENLPEIQRFQLAIHNVRLEMRVALGNEVEVCEAQVDTLRAQLDDAQRQRLREAYLQQKEPPVKPQEPGQMG
jgi:hypothetical protein